MGNVKSAHSEVVPQVTLIQNMQKTGFLGPFSARFKPLIPRTMTQPNEIQTQGSPNIGLSSPKISAKTVHVGPR